MNAVLMLCWCSGAGGQCPWLSWTWYAGSLFSNEWG